MAQLNTRLVLRNDIYTAWESANPVLMKGEIGVEYNPSLPTAEGQLDYTAKIKIGDGVNKWNDLPYFGGDSEVIEEVTQVVENIQTNVTNITNTIGDEATEGTIIYRVGTLETQIEALNAHAEEVDASLALKANAADVYTKNEIDTVIAEAVANAEHLKRVIIDADALAAFQAAPETAEKNVIYMVKVDALIKDSYQEFMRFDAEDGAVSLEQIGDTSVDLTDYVKTSVIEEVNAEVAKKADKVETEEALALIAETLAEKAEKVEVEAALELKADKAALEEVSGLVATKAEQEALNAAVERIVKNEQDIAANVEEIALLKTGLEGKADKATTLAGYGITDAYTKDETYDRTQIEELVNRITGGESAADVALALETYKGENNTRFGAIETKLGTVEEGAQANIIEIVKIAGTAIDPVEKAIEIPVATADAHGVVKLSAEIGANDAGALEVKSLNANKLEQDEGDWLILNGGNAVLG